MKKLIFTIVTLTCLTISLSAQSNQEDLIKKMEKMQEDMMKQFEGFNLQFADPHIQLDTFFFKGFGEGEDWMQLDGGSVDLSEMMNLLQQQLQQMDALDWEELGKLFQPFGSFGPAIPAPDSLDNNRPGHRKESAPLNQPKKKKKVYTL